MHESFIDSNQQAIIFWYKDLFFIKVSLNTIKQMVWHLWKLLWNVHSLSCLLRGSCGSMKNMIIVDVATKKERVGPFGCVISTFLCNKPLLKKWFGITNFYKNLYGLIKYNKTNDITPMKTHMKCAPPKLFA